MKVGMKVGLAFFSIGAIGASAAGLVAVDTARIRAEEQSFRQLVSVRESKSRQISDYFHQLHRQLLSLAGTPLVTTAMSELHDSYHRTAVPLSKIDEYRQSFREQNESRISADGHKDGHKHGEEDWSEDLSGSIAAIALQYHFIVANPAKTRADIDRVPVVGGYGDVHAKYHPFIRNYAKRFGLRDVFLIDMDGNIIYTVAKESDFATNLIDGPYRNANIATAFRNALAIDGMDDATLQDFAFYPPSDGAPAAFIAAPVFDGEKKTGVLIFQIPIDKIRAVMTGANGWRTEGLGETGETYLVGRDRTMRNDSRFLIEDRDSYLDMIHRNGTDQHTVTEIATHNTSILFQEVATLGSLNALHGKAGRATFDDYRGVRVLAAYSPINLMGTEWAILASISLAESEIPVTEFRRRFLLILSGLLAPLLLAALLFSRILTNPLRELTLATDRMSSGNLTETVTAFSGDEFGTLAASFNRMANRLSRSMVSRDYLNKILASMDQPLIVISWDVDNPSGMVIEETNPAVGKLLGYEESELTGQSLCPNILTELDHATIDLELLEIKGSVSVAEMNFIAKNGEMIPVLFSLALVFSDNEEAGERRAVFTAKDIRDRKLMEAKLRKMAHHDELTGLANRNLLHERLTLALSRSERYGIAGTLMVVDLDRFKPINDTLGHEAGDFVLTELASRLLSLVRASDTVARVGGDEFVLLLEEMSTRHDTEKFAQKIIKAMIAPVKYGNHECRVGASVGIASFPADTTDIRELIGKADEAMYRAKKAGRSTYCYSQKPPRQPLIFDQARRRKV